MRLSTDVLDPAIRVPSWKVSKLTYCWAYEPLQGTRKDAGAQVIIRRFSFFLARSVLLALRRERPAAVFIMGHMRCGSTFLLHILLTNPEIIACGERNAPYKSPQDFDKLEIFARIGQRVPFRRVRYVVDQINHDHITPNLELLQAERVRCIFLIRDPKETIRSILDLTRTFYEPWTVQRAVDYYCRRLETLSGYATRLGTGGQALSYHDLIYDTPSTLRRLESFLGLNQELREHYNIHGFTGKRGDPSGNIFRGRVVRNQGFRPVDIPAPELERAQQAYESCTRTITRATGTR